MLRCMDDSEVARLRQELVAAINAELDARGVTQVVAGTLLSMPQPRVSLLRQGRYEKFRLDYLIPRAQALGIDVDVELHRTGASSEVDHRG